MLLADVVSTSAEVAATRSRKAKVAALARRLAEATTEELPVAVAYLGGSLRQRRTGVGWRSVARPQAPADGPSLEILDVDALLEEIGGLSGAGSKAARAALLDSLLSSATASEQAWLRAALTDNVRQGASDSLVQEAVAAATGQPVEAVRRAAMLSGSTTTAAIAAFTSRDALTGIGLRVGRPVAPMLAASAIDVGTAMLKASGPGARTAIDAKLDGIRLQVHRRGDEVLGVTRTLDDITARLPEVAEVARSFAADEFVLDGEALWLDDTGAPRPFQETASRTSSAGGERVTPFFFDLLHLDGRDLVDAPAAERLAALDTLVPATYRVRRVSTDDPAVAQAFAEEVLAAGHEGVVVKDLGAPYAAGRRGSSWVKVKPVHTVDLVVLAVEHGSGRRTGTLSNIHLGARDADGGLTLVGKTFKGMTDELLAWQTDRFHELQTSDDGWVVTVRPEQVVEIAFDGVQRSTRYAGGVALRFARVVRYRHDKRPEEADTLATLRGRLSDARSPT